MSANNRPTHPSTTTTTNNPTRFGFVPRATTPAIQQAQGSSLVERSRSISPSSANSVNASSSTTVSQRLIKPQSANRPVFNRAVNSSTTTTAAAAVAASKPKPSPASQQKDPPKSTITHRLRSNASSDTSTTSTPPTKTDVNAIRDRYKTQKRPNFLSRRLPMTNPLKPSSHETPVIEEEKTEPITQVSIEDSQVYFTKYFFLFLSIFRLFFCS